MRCHTDGLSKEISKDASTYRSPSSDGSVRKRVGDRKLNRTIMQFLKAGVLSEDQFLRTEAGTPQGGIISPLLANIALSVIEEDMSGG